MKHLKYLRNILRHKWFVFVECCKLGIPWLGVVHDWTKFLPSEWIAYARYFFGKYPSEYDIATGGYNGRETRSSESVERDFDLAWLHHQHRNKHHWQRWLMTLDSSRSDGKMVALPMPDKYRREMLADWRGAGRAYGNPNTAEWYREHRNEIILHPETREWVDRQLLSVEVGKCQA